ncbi:hypothetical protein Taro_024343, partial [Colocasia esculenta]|nr:hypothetical protein [Colocasia esculenta]
GGPPYLCVVFAQPWEGRRRRSVPLGGTLGRMLSCLRPAHQLPVRRFICRSAGAADMDGYREAFARRMAMAGIKPHHRIALGVSGGPDSMALCVLTAGWKSSGLMGKSEGSGFVDGLLGIVVDHRLRPESTDEANLIYNVRLLLVIGWMAGPSKAICNKKLVEVIGLLRFNKSLLNLHFVREDELVFWFFAFIWYQLFQNVCMEHRISVLLVAHHADDQAELFILRLSRNSGVLGLAGMAFVSQLFPMHFHYHAEISSSSAFLLVRPMLNFSKSDMYKVGILLWLHVLSMQL